VLLDQSRLRKRTQLKRAEYRSIGQPNLKTLDTDSDNKTNKTYLANLVDGRNEEYDEHIFDDSDFYQQLLRDIISDSSGNSSMIDGDLLRSAHSAKKRIKKGVDRRASKGRKVRYAVMPKLVNFMAPVVNDPSPMADHLFKSLFGQQSGTSTSTLPTTLS